MCGGVTLSSLRLFRRAPVPLVHGLLPPRPKWLQVWVPVLGVMEARLPPILRILVCKTLSRGFQ